MTWQQGQSGNPGGRSKHEKIWKDAIFRAIKRRERDDPQAMEKLADVLITKASEGDIAALKEFADRTDGKVPQAIIGDNDFDPIQHSLLVEFVDAKAKNNSPESV